MEKDIINMTNYEIGKEIGHGAFGKVYEIKDITTDEKYAMKVIDKSHRSFFKIKDEVLIQRSFKHPNIVKIEKSFETNEKVVIIMEKCGKDLLSYKNEKLGKIDFQESKDIFFQICSAVDYIHRQGYAHRDLKPENVMNCGKKWKLIDFGYAIKEDAKIIGLCCTLDFAAPESILADEYNPYFGKPTDIWAMGIILFEMIYGRTPFSRSTKRETISAILSEPVVFPETPDIPEGIKDLIEKMLAKKVSNRVDISYVFDKI